MHRRAPCKLTALAWASAAWHVSRFLAATPTATSIDRSRGASRRMHWKPRSGLDMIIAAVAGANQCVVVTGNESDFVGLQIVNPMRGAT